MQPGNTIQPGGSSEEPTWQFSPEQQSGQQSSSAPASASSQSQPPATITTAPNSSIETQGDITWTASEFISHQKTGGWYLILFGVAIVFAGLVFLLTNDAISSIVVIILAAIFAFMGSRKPRELQYRIDKQGLQIGEKLYPYGTFRSFAMVQEDGIDSIWFMPLKRFMPIVSIYFDPKDGEKIVSLLNQNLPVEDHEPELVDRLMHRIRF